MADSNAAIAVQVEGLRRELAGLQEAVNGEAGLAQQLGSLARLIQAHIEAEDERAASVAAPVWSGLADSEYRDQLARLAVFVDEHLRVAYREYLRTVLYDCWPGHAAALWELGNLWAEWNRIYKDRERPDLAAALTWHDRWLPGVRARLKDTMQGCRAGGCGNEAPPLNGRAVPEVRRRA
jgi:hypothetical protein